MIKKRPVVVIGKHRGQYIIVPISSTRELNKKEHKAPDKVGFHVQLQPGDMPITARYIVERECWAKSNLLMTIDGGRLNDIYNTKERNYIPANRVSEETLRKIRQGVIISIGLRDLLNK